MSAENGPYVESGVTLHPDTARAIRTWLWQLAGYLTNDHRAPQAWSSDLAELGDEVHRRILAWAEPAPSPGASPKPPHQPADRFRPCLTCGDPVDTWLAGTTYAMTTPAGVTHAGCLAVDVTEAADVDWRAMFTKYMAVLKNDESSTFLGPADWTPAEWAAIQALPQPAEKPFDIPPTG